MLIRNLINQIASLSFKVYILAERLSFFSCHQRSAPHCTSLLQRYRSHLHKACKIEKKCFSFLILQRNIQVDSDGSEDQLTDVYMRHVIPLPQRDLPNSRWGRKMQKTRVGHRSSQSHSHRWEHPSIWKLTQIYRHSQTRLFVETGNAFPNLCNNVSPPVLLLFSFLSVLLSATAQTVMQAGKGH